MCVSDWRLGRLIKTTRTAQIISPGNPVIILPNRQRVGFSVGLASPVATTTSGLTISIDTINATFLNVNNCWAHWTLQDNGDLPTLQFTLTAIVAVFNGISIEYLLPEAALKDDMRGYLR